MNTVMRTKNLILGLLLSTALCAQAYASGLTSSVDRTSIEMDESITLKVVFDAFQAQGEPDFSHLKQNFDIASNNRSSQQSYVNGTVTASTEWRMTLFPKKTGQLLIPPFSFQGYNSQAININVIKSQGGVDVGVKPDIFLETEIDKSDIYVQEQAIVTYKLFFSRSVSSLDAAEIKQPNLRVEELPRADYQKTIGQRTYGVAEFRYALIPDASGDISIPSKTWTIESTETSGNRFYNGGRRKLHRVKTEAIELKVKPKPDNYPIDQAWLPASNLTLSERWSQTPDKFTLGEPITRTVTIQAEGVAAEQLPPIFDDVGLSDFKFYPDKPNQENNNGAKGLAGSRTESVAIVPTRSGALTLPEISVTWWDTNTQSVQKTTLPAVNVQITEPSGTAPSAALQRQSILPEATEGATVFVEKTSKLWLVIAAISIVLNALLLALLLRLRLGAKAAQTGQDNVTPYYANANKAFGHVEHTCKNRDAAGLRAALITWGALSWPEHKITGLQDIALHAKNQELSTALQGLNSALFSNTSTSIDYERILKLLKQLPSHKQQSEEQSALQPLYRT